MKLQILPNKNCKLPTEQKCNQYLTRTRCHYRGNRPNLVVPGNKSIIHCNTIDFEAINTKRPHLIMQESIVSAVLVMIENALLRCRVRNG